MVTKALIGVTMVIVLGLLFFGAGLQAVTGADAISWAVEGAFLIIGYLIFK